MWNHCLSRTKWASNSNFIWFTLNGSATQQHLATDDPREVYKPLCERHSFQILRVLLYTHSKVVKRNRHHWNRWTVCFHGPLSTDMWLASRCVYTCALNSSPAKRQPQSEWQRLPESQAQKSATCAFRHRHEAVTFLEQLWRWLPCQWRFWSANGTDVSASASCARKVSFLFFLKNLLHMNY